MYLCRLRLAFTFCLLFFCLTAFSQISEKDLKAFDEAGLQFNYPATWALTDKSSLETQHLLLSPPNSNVLIIIITPKSPMSNKEVFRKVQQKTTDDYHKAIARSLNVTENSGSQESLCTEISSKLVTGLKFNGTYKNEPAKGEVYPFSIGHRFLTLVYLRSDKEGQKADNGWQAVIKSLKIGGKSSADLGDPLDVDYKTVGIINGKARELVKPMYPSGARSLNVSGVVQVQVIVDEKGYVIDAQPISGHPTLLKVSKDAAKLSKFTPTYECGHPTKVSGIIVYNFQPPRFFK